MSNANITIIVRGESVKNLKFGCFLFIYFFLFSHSIIAQDLLGNIFFLKANTKTKNGFEYNFQFESRQSVFAEKFFSLEYVLTDFSLLVGKSIGKNYNAKGGYLFRIKGAKIYHRGIQNITYSQNINDSKLSHRIEVDETFSEKVNTKFRFRYRVGVKKLIKTGKKFYVEIYNEYLNIFQGNKYDLEIRLVPLLGLSMVKRKLELGIDYRVNSFIHSKANNTLWVTVSYIINL